MSLHGHIYLQACMCMGVCALYSQGHVSETYEQRSLQNVLRSKADHCKLRFHLEIYWNAASLL